MDIKTEESFIDLVDLLKNHKKKSKNQHCNYND